MAGGGGGGEMGGSDTRLGGIGILSKTITLIEFVLYFSLFVFLFQNPLSLHFWIFLDWTSFVVIFLVFSSGGLLFSSNYKYKWTLRF